MCVCLCVLPHLTIMLSRFNNNNNNNEFYLKKRLSGHSRTLYITHNKTHNEIYKGHDKIDKERNNIIS